LASSSANADLPLAVGPAISASGGREGLLVFIATLIAKQRLSSGDISQAEDALAGIGIHRSGRSWIEPETACDILFPGQPAQAREVLEGLVPEVDVVVHGEARRPQQLLGA